MVDILASPSPRLGEMLLDASAITPEALARALASHHHTRSPLGRTLIAEEGVAPTAIYRALAAQYGLAFTLLDLSSLPAAEADHTLPEAPPTALSLDNCLRFGVLPLAHDAAGWQLATIAPEPAARAEVEALLGQPVQWCVITPRDWIAGLKQRFATTLDVESRLALWLARPELSARYLWSTGTGPDAQTPASPLRRYLHKAAWAAIIAVALWVWHDTLWIAALLVLNLFYTSTLLLKALLFAVGMRHIPAAAAEQHLTDDALPVYSILVPLYREERSLPHLLHALRSLDYPAAKLDIKLIVEADDNSTYEALKQLTPEAHMDIIRVPHSLPKTKPKACNYALPFVRGEFVTIYDAEDRPHPQQLRQAVARFRTLPADVACLQARLNYYNRDENALTRLFALEYACWFDVMLPGLERLGIPIPLGGTSNHLRSNTLRAIGAWDPFNVTEDADLGMRLAQHGFKTAMLDSDTLEESPIRLLPWIRQRSRWVKGYMQTWLVHMRAPAVLYQRLGSRAFWGFQCFVGGPCLVFLLSPLVWVLSLAWVWSGISLDHSPLSGAIQTSWFWWAAMANLGLGLGLHLALALLITWRRRWPEMVLSAILFPFYWWLHSLAAWRALGQLITRPHEWEKTPHGESKTLDSEPFTTHATPS